MLSLIRRTLQSKQPQSAYQRMGGQPTVRAITQRFYQLMADEPEYQTLRAQHPDDLSHSEQKLFEFFSGWLGGPPLFEQKHGHPRLRARHFAFHIDKQQRNLWLHCMKRALEIEVSDRQVRRAMLEALIPLADHLRNIEESACPLSQPQTEHHD